MSVATNKKTERIRHLWHQSIVWHISSPKQTSKFHQTWVHYLPDQFQLLLALGGHVSLQSSLAWLCHIPWSSPLCHFSIPYTRTVKSFPAMQVWSSTQLYICIPQYIDCGCRRVIADTSWSGPRCWFSNINNRLMLLTKNRSSVCCNWWCSTARLRW